MPANHPNGYQRLFAAAASGVLITSLACGAPPVETASGPDQGAPPSAYVPDYTLQDSLAGWYALGIGAHHLCSGLWVVGRDYERTPEQVVAEDIAPFSFFRWESGFTWSVDVDAWETTVTSDKYGSRTAEYNGDQGCSILPAGNDGVFFQPQQLTTSLPEASEQDWPTGDRGAFADFTSGDFSQVDQTALDAAFDFAFDDASMTVGQNTRGLIAVYDGKIVAERYADGWGPSTPQISWSMGKSIVSALTGTLVQQGYFGLDDPAPVPAWRQAIHDPRSEIRIQDLLRMSGGLDFDNLGLNADVSYTTAN
ncbi:MAG: serine hydrolase, partial [Longimicrobiales bacterium]